MRLSDAIRLGAMLKPQGFGFYQTLGGSCAYGAALDAIGVRAERQNTIEDDTITALFPISAARTRCPICTPDERAAFEPVRDVDSAITHLNDDHRWTREQIADFVASIECREESRAVDASDPHVAHPGTLTTRVKEFSSSSSS